MPRDARSCDLDHIDRYVPPDHDRTYTWHGPHGGGYLVTPTGTIALAPI